MPNGILLEREGPVARITLDRPDLGNAFDIPMARELMETVIRVAGDDAIRCVVLTGSGRLFCAGGDVKAFSNAGDQLPDFLKEITVYLHGALANLARMPKPLVGAINGPVAGAGVGVAILGDIVLADPSAHFTLAYTGIGMSPDGGTTWLLPRLIGLRRAQEICLTNRRIGAEEAAQIGLVTRVTEAGKLAEESAALAQQLAAGATTALGATRRLLADSFSATFESHMEAESRSISAQGRSKEGREGIAAFVEKRKPDFPGLA